MKGVNKAIIVGSIIKDPEILNGLTKFCVATSESWIDKQMQKQEKSEFHNCVAFSKLAEICGKYLKKGSKVYIEGKIETSSYEKDGIKRYSTSINVREMQMLDSKPKDVPQAQNTPSTLDSSWDDFGDEINF